MGSNVSTNVDVQGYLGTFLSSYEGPIAGDWSSLVMKRYETDSITDIFPGGRVVSGLKSFGYGNCRTDNTPANFRYLITKSPFRDEVTLDRMDYELDKLGIFNGLVSDMGVKAKLHWNKLVASAIVSNGNAYDGAAFFGTHSIGVDSAGKRTFDAGFGTAKTYKNVLTATDNAIFNVTATSNVPTDVEAASHITYIIGYMQTLPDYAGDPVNGGLRNLVILTPDASKFAAYQSAVTKTLLSGTQSNSVEGFLSKGYTVDVELIPELAAVNSGNTVIFVRGDANVPAFIGTENPTGIRSSFQGFGSDFQQNCDTVRFNIQVDRGLGYGEPTAAIEVTLS